MSSHDNLSDLDLLDQEYRRSDSVFHDESKLSADYVPDNLLFRTDQLRFLVNHFRGIFSPSGMNRGLILTGPIGSGKTSISKKFGEWAVNKGVRSRINIRYIHINCRVNRTPFMILLAIARHLNPHIPNRGYSAHELMEIINQILEAKEYRLLVVLDEVDFCGDEDLSDVLYALTRANDGTGARTHEISLLLISRTLDFVQKLDESTRSSLTTANLKLSKYEKEHLIGIIEDRAKLALNGGVLTDESIELAAEIASGRGDARQALELIWYAGKAADNENSDQIHPDHIREAKSNVDPSLLRQSVTDLSKSKMLLLLGIARRLRHSKMAYVTTGEAKEAYKMACEEYEARARKHTQIWEYLKEFEKNGIIQLRMSGKQMRGTTQLISVQDATARELEQAVLKRIDNAQ